MPTLEELKAKWFIDVKREGAFPPQTRHKGALVSDYTDGNHLEPLIDGAALMAEFHQHLQMILNADDPSQWELYVSAMNIHPVKLLGANDNNGSVKSRLLQAAEAGVNVYYLGSGHVGADEVSIKFAKKLAARGSQGAADRRFPPYGGQHQKFTVARGPENQWLATLGSADFFIGNWDTSDHLGKNPNRPKGGGPIHNLSLSVKGPAIHDIALTFAERWNDAPSWNLTSPQINSKLVTDFVDEPIPDQGGHSVQLLRSYGIESKPGESYSWAHQGEFTVWASYINAIKKAERYIYIEDQYFFPFGFHPQFDRPPGRGRDSDIFYQLGQALKRGVHIIALVPGRNDSIFKRYEIQARRRGADYLRRITENHPGSGRFILTKLHVDGQDPVIHSKVMLVDDEFALVGSTNVAQRSMCLCSEIHMAIVDEANEFTRDLRLRLWGEHLELANAAPILKPEEAIELYYANAQAAKGRLRLLPTTRIKPELPNKYLWDKYIDPYYGPDRE